MSTTWPGTRYSACSETTPLTSCAAGTTVAASSSLARPFWSTTIGTSRSIATFSRSTATTSCVLTVSSARSGRPPSRSSARGVARNPPRTPSTASPAARIAATCAARPTRTTSSPARQSRLPSTLPTAPAPRMAIRIGLPRLPGQSGALTHRHRESRQRGTATRPA
jgi:hypothetical protein